jgi:outer membrane protein assembly factor BamD
MRRFESFAGPSGSRKKKVTFFSVPGKQKTAGPTFTGSIINDQHQLAQLDGTEITITLRHPMNLRLRPVFFFTVAAFAFPQLGDASVIFKPGEKAKYVAPGEEQISGNSEQLFHMAQEAEKKGDLKRAIRAYKALVRRHPKDALAPGSVYRAAELQEQLHQYLSAADSYRGLVAAYPSSPHFNEAIEAQFRIGEMYLNGKKIKFLGISVASALDRAVEIFAAVIRTAPYGRYTARAQYDIGRAREKEGANDAAIQAYQAVVEKFPNDAVAADAQYQIGYIWFVAAREGTKDIAAASNARTAFQDFLFRYPNSEKAAQARANLLLLEHKQTSNSFNIAKYYDKQKYYRAAVIYYNEVIRQQPGSSESEKAKKRIDQLRAKVGEAKLKPAFAAAEEAAAKKKATEKGSAKTDSAGAVDSTPLPPSEADPSLPPPASLLPDTTTAPASAPGSAAGATSEPSATPATSPADSDSPAP